MQRLVRAVIAVILTTLWPAAVTPIRSLLHLLFLLCNFGFSQTKPHREKQGEINSHQTYFGTRLWEKKFTNLQGQPKGIKHNNLDRKIITPEFAQSGYVTWLNQNRAVFELVK